MSDPIDIVERLREAQSAVDSFRGDLGSAAFEDACRTARHRAFLAAPALLAQLDEQAAEITRLRALSAQPAAAPDAATIRAQALEDAAKVCDVTPPYPFRPSIEAAHAIRKLAASPRAPQQDNSRDERQEAPR